MNSTLAQSRILIVDDDETNVLVMTRILQTAGYRNIKGITDARAVLDSRRTWAPDLILLDLHMPHVDGMSLLHAFQAQSSRSEFVPVLVLTADPSRDTLKGALSAGANDFLTKPVDVDEVLLRVRNLLAIRLSHEGLKNSNVALAGELRQRMRSEERQAENRRARIDAIRAVIERRPTMVFQPVVELATSRIVGFEALARFDGETSPDRLFAEATTLGLGTELELAAVKAALEQLDRLQPEQFMAVNASPTVVLDYRLPDLLRKQGWGRVVVEITEHQPVESYEDLNLIRARFRRDGIRVAIDDAGAGYASLHHILKLAPDIIKLDISLTRDIDRDPIKRALAVSLVQFAKETGAIVIAEGIETAAELETLRALAVSWGQGYHLGYPAPLEIDHDRISRVG
jgi:EAL domain-containing protein (putative c-di-GMP-specific phosphodiesterase class I)/CheY-like chemotaxis protein